MDRQMILLAALGGHLAIAVVHGTSHALLSVTLPTWQNGLVVLTTFLGPVIGVGLDARDHPIGVPLFTVSLAGALLLGGVLHFLVENPDHVRAVPAGAWRWPFQASAAGLAFIDMVGLAVGIWMWRSRSVRGP